MSAAVQAASKAELGQFLTPGAVAQFMAGMFGPHGKEISLLDAGAGMGSLSVALIAELASRRQPPRRIRVALYEVDSRLAQLLERTMAACSGLCADCGIALECEVLREDFIDAATSACALPLTRMPRVDFDCAILNPPYRKINGDSDTRRVLSAAGIEVNNLYSAILALAARLLKPDGELVAITPRSFCNGPCFRTFQRGFFSRMVLHQIHVYESRSDAFRDDEVLNLSGHTQVNAQDLRRLKYPNEEQLLAISNRLGDDLSEQDAVDRAVEQSLELAYSIQGELADPARELLVTARCHLFHEPVDGRTPKRHASVPSSRAGRGCLRRNGGGSAALSAKSTPWQTRWGRPSSSKPPETTGWRSLRP